MLNFSAKFSAVIPIAGYSILCSDTRETQRVSIAFMSFPNGTPQRAPNVEWGILDITSTPPARPVFANPASISKATCATA